MSLSVSPILTRRDLRNLRHSLLTERHPSGPTYDLPNLWGPELSKDLYFFDNRPFTD